MNGFRNEIIKYRGDYVIDSLVTLVSKILSSNIIPNIGKI